MARSDLFSERFQAMNPDERGDAIKAAGVIDITTMPPERRAAAEAALERLRTRLEASKQPAKS